MLYRDAFRKLIKDPIAAPCMVVVVICALIASYSYFDSLSESIETRTFDSPDGDYKGDDEQTLLKRTYHPPTLMLALGDFSGVEGYNSENDTFDEKKVSATTQKRLRKIADDGIFSSTAWHLPLGADANGRNVLHMTIHGMRFAFLIGIITTAISIVVAVVFGSVAGYFGGFVDDLIVWFYTTLASVPFLLLLVAIMGSIPPNWKTGSFAILPMLFVIGLTTWVGLARLIRAEFMKHKAREYVQACRALGYGHTRTIFGHILPNVMHIVIITFTLGFVSSVNIEVFLTFVGVGVGATDPTWGRIIATAKTELTREPSVWWPLTSATVFLFVLSLSFSIFGDALRDALDPKLRS